MGLVYAVGSSREVDSTMSNWLYDRLALPRPTLWIALLGSAIGWLCAFCLLILYQTIVPHAAPVAFDDVRVTGWADAYASTLFVSYTWQEIPMEDANDVGVRSSIDCKVDKYNQTFDLPILTHTYRAHRSRPVNRLAVYPYPVPVGSECAITTTLEWTPTLSVNKHTWTFPKSTFTVLVSPTLP